MKLQLTLLFGALSLTACSKQPEAAANASNEGTIMLDNQQDRRPSVLTANSPKPAAERPADKTVVPVYSGHVDATSAARLLELVSNNQDTVVGLKLWVETDDSSNDRYSASVEGDRLVISAGDPMSAPVELVVNGPNGYSHGMVTVDGFYLIKSGGTHAAGAMSWGAEPVDEATVRLNPHIKTRTHDF